MSVAGEMIAGAVVKQVAGKLSQTAWERMGGMFWNFKDDVQDMENKMGTLQVVLSYTDKRSRGRGTTDDDTLAQHWLKKYKSVAYAIEDAMDELEANATLWKRSPSKVKLVFSSVNPLIVRIAMSNKMRSIRLQLDRIAEDANKFNFLPSSAPSTEQTNDERGRETYIGARDDIQMVGRKREKKHILKLLQNQKDQESSIIPIVGLGGLGKTTIAKFVYTLKETDEFQFDLKAWVYVSMDFKLEKITAGGVMGYMKSGDQTSFAAGGISALVLYFVHTQLTVRPVFALSIGLGISDVLLSVMGLQVFFVSFLLKVTERR